MNANILKDDLPHEDVHEQLWNIFHLWNQKLKKLEIRSTYFAEENVIW